MENWRMTNDGGRSGVPSTIETEAPTFNLTGKQTLTENAPIIGQPREM